MNSCGLDGEPELFCDGGKRGGLIVNDGMDCAQSDFGGACPCLFDLYAHSVCMALSEGLSIIAINYLRRDVELVVVECGVGFTKTLDRN